MKTLLYLFLIVVLVGCDFDFPDLDLDFSLDYTPYWQDIDYFPDPEYLVELDDTTNLGVRRIASQIWGKAGDIPGLRNNFTADAALADFDGQENSASIYNYYPARPVADCFFLSEFKSWYLPSAGELNLVLEQLRDTLGTGLFWSSTEADSIHAWGMYYASGPRLIQSRKDSTANRCLCVRKLRK